MRISVIATPEGPASLVRDSSGVLLEADAAQALIAPLGAALPPALGHAPAGAPMLAPLAPPKIVAIGLNYLDHVRETGMETPAAPLVFAKFPSSVIGPGATVQIDRRVTERVDWEVELGVVIGTRMRDVSVETALDHVFAYTVVNDVSARDVQFGDGQWVRGKSLDTFCPLGPELVSADEVPDPQKLNLSTTINGDLVQNSSTAEMIFGVAELLAYCSRSFTLEPGDLVATGTPWGCGEFAQPRRSLADGDEMVCQVETVGTLVNPVRVI